MDSSTFEIDDNRDYTIEQVAFLTDYSTGHLRALDKSGKIPKSFRDEKNYRHWMGKDIKEIIKYRDTHPSMKKEAEEKKETPVITQ